MTLSTTASSDASPDSDQATGDVLVLPVAWRSGLPFAWLGSASILAGGVVAAVSRPTGFEQGPWVAAFLVLVAGVAQLSLGVGQAALASASPTPLVVIAELALWNLGCVLTIVGTLAAAPVLTTIGGVAVIAALVVFLWSVLTNGSAGGWLRIGYLTVLWFVLASTPVGLLLAWLRHS